MQCPPYLTLGPADMRSGRGDVMRGAGRRQGRGQEEVRGRWESCLCYFKVCVWWGRQSRSGKDFGQPRGCERLMSPGGDGAVSHRDAHSGLVEQRALD